MSKIAVVDFDGVIADMTIHTQIARERAHAFALQQAPDPESKAYRKAASAFFYSEEGYFDQDLLELDQPVIGSREALRQLLQEYDEVIVLTSRPPSLQEATLAWFRRYFPEQEAITFLFKESHEHEIKTAVWKAQIVAQFAKRCETVLFIDDDERNRKAVEALAAELSHVTIVVRSQLV